MIDVAKELQDKLLRSPTVAMRIAERAAQRFSELAQQAYDNKRGVSGKPFGKSEETGEQLDLKESGTLRNQALRYTAIGTKVRASVSAVRYARYQLKHGILPAKGTIPADWLPELQRIADEELAKFFGGK